MENESKRGNVTVHEPFEKTYPNADTIVVFLHGFIGSPNQFEDLADFAYAHNCSVLSLLLPGHGGTAKEFRKFRLNNWERHLEDELARVSASYQNVILVGHSIGGLLSLNASLNKNFNIKGVLLLSSPLRLKYSPHTLSVGIQLYLFPKRTDEILEAYRKANSITVSSIFSYMFWLKQTRDVYKLIKKTASNLPAITVSTTVLHSRKDELVSLKSADLFRDGLTNAEKKIITLNESWHAFYPPEERAVIRQELMHLIDISAKTE